MSSVNINLYSSVKIKFVNILLYCIIFYYIALIKIKCSLIYLFIYLIKIFFIFFLINYILFYF